MNDIRYVNRDAIKRFMYNSKGRFDPFANIIRRDSSNRNVYVETPSNRKFAGYIAQTATENHYINALTMS